MVGTTSPCDCSNVCVVIGNDLRSTACTIVCSVTCVSDCGAQCDVT